MFIGVNNFYSVAKNLRMRKEESGFVGKSGGGMFSTITNFG